jgi:hypothetical protein
MGKTTNQLLITDLIMSTNMLGKVGPLGDLVQFLANLFYLTWNQKIHYWPIIG